MTALAANKPIKTRNEGDVQEYDVAASATIYAGSLVMLKSDGYATPAAAASGNKGVVGWATAKVDNSAGADAALQVWVQEGEILCVGTTLEAEDVGGPVYAEDDQTIDETGAINEPRAGILTEIVSATSGYVKVGLGRKDGASHRLIAAGEATTAGGDATESITVTGALATDLAHVTIHTVGSSPVTILTSLATADALTVVFSADPSTDHVVTYSVIRAVA